MVKKLKTYILSLRISTIFTIILFFMALVYLLSNSYFHPKELSIAVGRESGAYYQHAQQYKKILKEQYNIELKIITTSGSQDAQQAVLNNKANFAIAQSSTEIYKKENPLVALANIAYEPIWICYKELNITNFSDLKEKRINIETKMSGTYPVAKLLLKQIDVKTEQKEYNSTYALSLLENKKLDSIFLTIGIKSKILNQIFETPQIKILDFQEASSYRNFFLKKSELSHYAFKDSHYFQVIEIKKDSLNLKNQLPKQDIELLTTQTMLLTKKDTPDRLVRLLLKVAQKVHEKASMLNEENHFPNCSMFKLKQHEASVTYFQEKEHRYEKYGFNNFWLAQTLKELEDWILLAIVPLSLLGFYIEVMYPTSKMLSRRKIDKWYRKVNQSDTNIETLNVDELQQRKKELKILLSEIQNKDNIAPIHLEAFYSLQNQITNTLETFEKRIQRKRSRKLIY